MATTDSDRFPLNSHPAIFATMRAVSRILTIGALLAVVFCYGSLPNELPVSRWHSAHKTWLLAVRVPVINLLSLGIIEVYGRSLSRYRRNSNANWIGPVLAVTAGIKALVESIEMLLLPTRHSIFAIVLIATVLAGVAFSIWCGRDLLKNENWKTLKSTCNEKAAMAALGATIIGLNVPLFLR